MIEHIKWLLAILLINLFLWTTLIWIIIDLLILLVSKVLLIVILDHVVTKGAKHALIILPLLGLYQLVGLVDVIFNHHSTFILIQFSLQVLYLLLVLLLKLDLVDLENIYFLLFLQELLLVLRLQLGEILLNSDISLLQKVVVLLSILELHVFLR